VITALTGKSGRRRSLSPGSEAYYRDVRRRTVIRLLLSYVAPIILLSVYFYFQYEALAHQSQRLHLQAIAENRANTLDLYLNERLVNLSNLIDDPRLPLPPSSAEMAGLLKKLQSNSETFVDLGYFDSSGVQKTYAGPFPSLENRNYRSESWFRSLRESGQDFVITDIYLGFREKPHFTIAVSRAVNGQFVVLRATLDPGRIYDYINPAEETPGFFTSIVNAEGNYQLVSPQLGMPLESSSFVPPETPPYGINQADLKGNEVTYAYSWLREVGWALIVQPAATTRNGLLSGFRLPFIGIAALIVLILTLIVFNRAGSIVRAQMESDRTRAQLEHAAKLASIGELAAGIAHEINNPLAVISEQAGLMRDYLDPQFEQSLSREEMTEFLTNIQAAVFRCRDITGKLLRFVRKTEVDLKKQDVHDIINGVVDGLLGPEFAVSNIKVVREYGDDLPPILTDANQLQQVFLNIINNAVDAIGKGPGTITVSTRRDNRHLLVAISDTGCGMTHEQMEQLFVPFFTTKEVGKGTGLGMSISYGIMKSLGGNIEVESEVGKGTTFTVRLPIR
jgi:two-component system NtrC family sensor kinase